MGDAPHYLQPTESEQPPNIAIRNRRVFGLGHPYRIRRSANIARRPNEAARNNKGDLWVGQDDSRGRRPKLVLWRGGSVPVTSLAGLVMGPITPKKV